MCSAQDCEALGSAVGRIDHEKHELTYYVVCDGCGAELQVLPSVYYSPVPDLAPRGQQSS